MRDNIGLVVVDVKSSADAGMPVYHAVVGEIDLGNSEHFAAWERHRSNDRWQVMVAEEIGPDMALAPGDRMQQEIYDDPYGLDAWDQRHGSRCFVSLLHTAQWMAITAERPPTARDYAARGLPWFDYYGGDARAVAGSEKLRGLPSVAQQAKATRQEPLPDNETIAARHVIALGKPRRMRENTVAGAPARRSGTRSSGRTRPTDYVNVWPRRTG